MVWRCLCVELAVYVCVFVKQVFIGVDELGLRVLLYNISGSVV